MSWDKFNYDETAICACGKGKVIRHMQQRDSDWNQSETYCLSEELLCYECQKKYHITHLCNYKHDGVIEYERIFLVPNGVNIPSVKTERSFYFSEIDKEIASKFSLFDIKSVMQDMTYNKYTTKLKLENSHSIVRLYFKRFKKKSLNLILPILDKIIQNYDSYEWTIEKIEEYSKIEREEIEKNNKAIEEAINQSFELDFKRD